MHIPLLIRRHVCTSVVIRSKMVKVLNVAEKNDAAKSISDVMSRGGFNRVSVRSGASIE